MSFIVLGIAIYLSVCQRKAEKGIKERCTAITSGRIDHTERSGFFNGIKLKRRGFHLRLPSIQYTDIMRKIRTIRELTPECQSHV